MSRPAPCVFCRQTRKLSREHVIAEHWRKLHGPENGTWVHRGYSADPITGDVKRHEGSKEAKTFDFRVPGVCKTCNETWMSGLEVAVKGMVGAIAEPVEDAVSLITPDETAKRLLVRWAAKTTVVIDRGLDGKKLALPDLVEAVRVDDDIPRLHTWIRILENAEAMRVSTRHVIVPTPQQDAEYRISIYSIHRCAVITVMCFDDYSELWLAALDPRALLGQEVQDCYVLPWGPPLPGPEVRYVKDWFSDWAYSRTDEVLHRRACLSPSPQAELQKLDDWQRRLEESLSAHGSRTAGDSE